MVVTRVEVRSADRRRRQPGVPLSSFEPVRDKLAEGLKTVSPESRQRWRKSLRTQLENASSSSRPCSSKPRSALRELLR